MASPDSTYTQFLETIPDAALVVDPAAKIVEANSQACLLLGYEPGELLGQSVQILVPESRRQSHAQQMQSYFISPKKRPLGTRQHLSARRKDGSELPVDIVLSPVEIGGVSLTVCIVVDISELAGVEAALRQSEEKYRLLVENASEVFYYVSIGDDPSQARMTFASPQVEALTGRGPAEIRQDPDFWLQALHPDDRADVIKAGQAVLSGAQVATFAYRIWNIKQQEYRWVEDHVVPRIDPQGRVIGFQGVARDVTERRRRERELEAIAQVTASLRIAQNRADMLPVILDQTLELLNASGTALDLYDSATGEVVIEAARGAWAPVSGQRIPPGRGVMARVIAAGQPYVSEDVASDPQFYATAKVGGVRAAACVPLIAQGQAFGGLWAARQAPFTADEIRLLTAIADIAANAINRASLHEQTERRLHQLTALREIDMAITTSVDVQLTLNVFLSHVLSQLGVHAADILLLDPHTQRLQYTAGQGLQTREVRGVSTAIGEGRAGRAALERRIIVAPAATGTGPSSRRTAVLQPEAFVSYYGVPLIAKGQVLGVLELFHRRPLNTDPEWLGFLEALARQAAIAIENSLLFDEIRRANIELGQAYDATIEGWSRALDLRDKETEGHTRRVTEITERLARATGVSEPQLVHIRRGALLHDIGKMGVPDSILLKPGPLTEDEWSVMRRHPQYAYDMLAPIAYLRPALDIPYCHHEKWDGTGYPRGLRGEQIPLAARLFAVVDVWDALRSDRPYRPAWSADKAREYIREQAGRHFDPQVAKAFWALEIDGRSESG